MVTRRRLFMLAGAGVAVAATSGCWVHSNYRHGPPSLRLGIVYIDRAPPPPRRIPIPPRPVVGAIWIGGFWRWTGFQYVWVDGYWDRNPPPGKIWTPGRWIHTSRGWYWDEGRWR